jgi:L-lactate dehydrogenase complex protein LldF
MSEPQAFSTAATAKAHDEVHRKKLLKVIGTYDTAVIAQKNSQFLSWQDARGIASEIKRGVISRLPQLLELYEANAQAHGVTVLWAKDVASAQKHLSDIISRHHVKSVVKSKSMTTEEIHTNEFLEERGISVVESDLGELIVQLAGEKPYHIVTPCMHKSKEEISELFHEKLGTPRTDSAEELAGAARVHLRNHYVTADLGITGANFIIAEEGAIHVLENEGNGRLTMACPPVHVALAGIEKVLPSLRELELFLPLLATSGTGQQVTVYNSIVRGPKKAGERDGPEHMYVILLDNGRSTIYATPEVRESLACIRCGACLNACPVYKSIGGHSYRTPYQGPIGAVITPHLKGVETWQHLAFASTLCGACSDVCPVKIPLHRMILWNRRFARTNAPHRDIWARLVSLWSFIASRPLLYGILSRAARVVEPLVRVVSPIRIPKLASKRWTRE